MTLLKFLDASTPVKPSGFDGTAFYIGGATPHIWTPQEIEQYSYPLKVPIYVPTYFDTGSFVPTLDAADCLNKLEALGAPSNIWVQLDFETLINPNYVRQFDDILWRNGYLCILYGSSSTVFQNPEPHGGYWAATRPNNSDYSGDNALYPGSNATQWQDFGSYDANVVIGSAPVWGAVKPVVPTQGKEMYLISVSPDPTSSNNTGTGIFAVHEALGPIHLDTATYATVDPTERVWAVSPAYYQELVAAAQALTSKVSGTISGTVTGTVSS